MNYLKTFFLLTAMTLLFMFVGGAIGGPRGMQTAFLLAVAMNFFSYWFSDKIVLMSYRAQPADENKNPELFRVVRNLCQRIDIPQPKIYIIPSDTPNAFATGRNPKHAAVACTTGILGLLNERELAGVLAHELGHVHNRDILISTIAASLAGAVMMLANMARWGAMFGGSRRSNEDRGSNPLLLLVMIVLAPLAATLIQLAVSRSREYGADEAGAKFSGDPLALASALRKLQIGNQARPMANAGTATAHLFIVNPLTAQSFAGLFSTHPPIAERIARLESMVGRG